MVCYYLSGPLFPHWYPCRLMPLIISSTITEQTGASGILVWYFYRLEKISEDILGNHHEEFQLYWHSPMRTDLIYYIYYI